MFGYVLPRRDKLTQDELSYYRAAYCGLCRSLKKRYGFRARFLVNYDMTFLYLLFQGREKKTAERCFCPARIFCKKDCLPVDEAMTYATDMTVLLSYWKLCDSERDGRFFKALAAKVAKLLYRRAYRKAAGLHADSDRIFSEQLQRLHRLEEASCDSLDRPADAFAKLLGGCAAFFEEEHQRRATEQLLYHVGRFVYLTDALEDLPKDEKAGAYNPIRFRYPSMTAEEKQQLLQTIDASVDMAASALELLEPNSADPLLKNIIYYGLPGVLRSVANGTFRNKRGSKQ